MGIHALSCDYVQAKADVIRILVTSFAQRKCFDEYCNLHQETVHKLFQLFVSWPNATFGNSHLQAKKVQNKLKKVEKKLKKVWCRFPDAKLQYKV